MCRAAVLQRDDWACRVCGAQLFASPVVHHTVELSAANVMDAKVSLNPELLISVCTECHNMLHEKINFKEKVVIVGEDLEIDYSRR